MTASPEAPSTGPSAKDDLSSFLDALELRDRLRFRAACVELASLPPDDTIPALLERIDPSNREHHEGPHAEAIEAIGNLALPSLIHHLETGSARNRAAAAIGIRKLIQDPWDHLTFEGDRLSVRGPSLETAVTPLSKALRGDATELVRLESAVTLGKIGMLGRPAVVDLAQAMTTGSEAMKVAAGTALGKIGSAAASAVPVLMDHLTDTRALVRRTVAIALGRIGPSAAQAVTGLIEALFDEKPEVREEAAAALGKMGPSASGAVMTLGELLQDPSAHVRFMAAVALAKMNAGEKIVPVIPLLVEALLDRNHRVRRRAAQALGTYAPSAQESIPFLIPLLSDEECRLEAAWSLGRMGPGALEALAPVLESTNRDTRLSAVTALAAIAHQDSRRATSLLQKRAQTEKDEEIREVLVRSLASLRGQEVLRED